MNNNSTENVILFISIRDLQLGLMYFHFGLPNQFRTPHGNNLPVSGLFEFGTTLKVLSVRVVGFLVKFIYLITSKNFSVT